MDYVFLLSLLVVGGGVGFLAGLLGVGGGMTMVPFMVMLFGVRDFPPGEIVKIAIATSLAVNLFTSLSSLRAHHQHGAVRMDLLKTMGLGALIGTFLGANAAGALDGSILAGFFGLFVGYSAWQILKGRKPKPGRVVPGGLALGLVGGCIGAISSLLGAGGGFLTIPFLTWCNVSMHHAVATSAGLGFPIALGDWSDTHWPVRGWRAFRRDRWATSTCLRWLPLHRPRCSQHPGEQGWRTGQMSRRCAAGSQSSCFVWLPTCSRGWTGGDGWDRTSDLGVMSATL